MADTSIPDGSFIVPAGENVHSGLRSSFVKMDGLLAYLDEDQFNGYVLLHGLDEGTGADGLLLFQAGKVVGASYGDSQGDEAQERIGERVAGRVGNMDIVSLEPSTVEALASSFGEQSPYSDLRTAFVDLGKLVDYLQGQGFSGSVSLSGSEGRAVVLIKDGQLLGAYNNRSRGLESDLADVVGGIGADGEGAIRISSVTR